MNILRRRIVEVLGGPEFAASGSSRGAGDSGEARLALRKRGRAPALHIVRRAADSSSQAA